MRRGTVHGGKQISAGRVEQLRVGAAVVLLHDAAKGIVHDSYKRSILIAKKNTHSSKSGLEWGRRITQPGHPANTRKNALLKLAELNTRRAAVAGLQRPEQLASADCAASVVRRRVDVLGVGVNLIEIFCVSIHPLFVQRLP